MVSEGIKIKWIDTEDFAIVCKICNRARKKIKPISKMDFEKTILALHSNGCPLDLKKFLKEKDSDFFYDVYGIINHYDHTTEKLRDYFLPHCSLMLSSIIDEKGRNFYDKSEYGRYPDWKDAIAHCAEKVRAVWIKELKKRGLWRD